MPAAAPAIAAAIIASSYSGWVAAGIMMAGAALSTGVGYLQQRKALQNLREMDVQGIRANTRSTQSELRSFFGLNRVGGNDVFMESTGTDRKKLWIVQTLSDGRCNGIRTVDGVPQVRLGDKLWNEYGHSGELVKLHFHDGSAGQAVDEDLAAAFPDWTDCMRNTCYIVYEIDYDSNWFQGLPQRTVELEGRLVWDYRTSEWVYSSNAALVLYCYMTDESFPLEYPASHFDFDTWTAAADYCDLKGYTWQGSITPDMSPPDVINSITANFRGKLTYPDGKFGLKVLDLNYEATVMTLTDEHILRDESGRAMITVTQPGRYSRPDALKVRFVNPDKDYTEDHVIVGDETGAIKDYALPGCHSRDMAATLGAYELERQRLDRTISFPARGDAMRLEPTDAVVLDLPELGMSGYLMRVIEAEILPDQLVNLALAFESESLYNDVYDLRTDEVYTCSLPDPQEEPPSVSNVTVEEEVYSYRLRSFTRLKVSFGEPENYPWFDHAEVYISLDNVEWKYLFPASSSFQIDPVEEGVTYWLRIKSVNVRGVRQRDEDDFKISRQVLGKTSLPASVAALQAIVNSNSVALYAEKVVDADVELYEFRLGPSWTGAIFLAALRNPNLSLYGVKPGVHTFWIDTLSNNGQYGASPRSRTISLPDPPHGWSVQGSTMCDYSSGTHDNTEQTTYSGESYLKCSHTDGVLTGRFISPVYDLGSSASRLIYIQAQIVVTGVGTSWEDVIPGTSPWTVIDLSMPWSEIFSLPAGPSVRMTLLYGAASPPETEVERMEILSTVVDARYIRVMVDIVDPSEGVNAMVQALTIKRCSS